MVKRYLYGILHIVNRLDITHHQFVVFFRCIKVFLQRLLQAVIVLVWGLVYCINIRDCFHLKKTYWGCHPRQLCKELLSILNTKQCMLVNALILIHLYLIIISKILLSHNYSDHKPNVLNKNKCP